MWNVYRISETGSYELVAADCGSEENAWDVFDILMGQSVEDVFIVGES
jgi:hypothetical protein